MSEKRISEAQQLLFIHLKELGFKDIQFEYQFDFLRKWRADLFGNHYGLRCLFEIDGGAWTRGRHTRGKGFIADMEKLNVAQMLGYRVLRFTPEQVLSGKAKEWLKGWL